MTIEKPYTNTTYLVTLLKEYYKEINRYNSYLLNCITEAIHEEAKRDYMELDLHEVKVALKEIGLEEKGLKVETYTELIKYLNNLLESIHEEEIVIAERNYYRYNYEDY